MNIRKIEDGGLKATVCAEMEYKRNPYYREVLAEGKYKGHCFYVLSLGTHPCAYIRYDYDRIQNIQSKIDCHGGITYQEKTLLLPHSTSAGKFIGWDYNHCWDYNGYMIDDLGPWKENRLKHTTEEMISDCIDVIEQILKLEENEVKNNES